MKLKNKILMRCLIYIPFLALSISVLSSNTPSNFIVHGNIGSSCAGAPDLDCRNVPELICQTVCNQHQSLTIRDRCSYQQQLHMERFEKPQTPGQQPGKRKQLRETRVIIRPSVKEDETGGFLITTEVIADTDDEGKPKSRVDPKANTGLTSQAFLDLIFFPLLPEKLQYYEFEPVPAERENEKAFRFKPRANVRSVPLASGIVYIEPKTGEMLTLQINSMYNLDILDKHLKDIEAISATVDFSQFNDRFRMPTLVRGEGISNVTRFKGIFRFTFEESKYQPVLKFPNWASIKTK